MDYASGVCLKSIVCLAVLVVLATPAGANAHGRSNELSPWAREGAECLSKEEAERYSKEQEAKAAQERKTAEEQKAHEEQSQHPASEHPQSEETPQQAGEAAATTKQCIVPALKGDTLTDARRALRAAHCKLGRIAWPPRGHGRHVVRRQGLRAGSKHPADTAVAVTLGPVKLGR
jgi:hypothetical protein